MSKLILGTVQMGTDYGVNNLSGKISKAESFDIFHLAKENDIHLLDTAEVYGDAHQLIGSFHKENPNQKFDIITKIPSNTKNIKEKVLNYLKELNVGIIFTLMFHSFETLMASPFLLEEIFQLKREKYIQKIGVSVYTKEEVEKVAKIQEIEVVQMPFNLLDNHSQRGKQIALLKENGKTIHTRSSFLQGLFFADIQNPQKEITKALLNELKLIQEIANEEKCSINELAIAYCIQQENLDGILFGVDSLQQLEQNIQSSKFRLSANSLQTIDQILIKNTDLLNPTLWNKLKLS